MNAPELFGPDDKPGVAILGAGALGSALGRRLSDCGYPVQAVLSRHGASARRLAQDVGAPLAGTSPAELPEGVRVVFCCVPDDALESVVEELYLLPRAWKGHLVAHTSGALTAEVLSPLAVRGAATLSFHPLQSFGMPASASAFEGVYVGLEGSETAVATGRLLAAGLGLRPIVVPTEAKARYHLAAAMASNFFVTLMAMAEEVLSSFGVRRDEASALLRPLVEGTWQNVQRQMPEEALTGPISRGDRTTLTRHLEALSEHLPHLTPAYAAMAMETVRVAARSGRLDVEDAQGLLDELSAALAPRRDPLF